MRVGPFLPTEVFLDFLAIFTSLLFSSLVSICTVYYRIDLLHAEGPNNFEEITLVHIEYSTRAYPMS